MEDRRGEPRNKPPFPTTNGLFNRPTVINNVETLAWVPGIALHGGEWYRDQGIHGATGLRFVSISGDVNITRVYEVPFGQTVRRTGVRHGGRSARRAEAESHCAVGAVGWFFAGFRPATKPAAEVRAGKTENPARWGWTFSNCRWTSTRSARWAACSGRLSSSTGTGDLVEQALNCVESTATSRVASGVPCRLGSQKLTEIIKEMLARRFDKNASARCQRSVADHGDHCRSAAWARWRPTRLRRCSSSSRRVGEVRAVASRLRLSMSGKGTNRS